MLFLAYFLPQSHILLITSKISLMFFFKKIRLTAGM